MRIRILSWGCGVQSTTLGEMAAQGLLDPLDAILTADTGWERQVTYEMRDWYIERWRRMGRRVEVVSAGNVRIEGMAPHINIPFWTQDGGPLWRECTKYFKIMPLRRRCRELAGYHPTIPPHPKTGEIEQWLGISLDEYQRIRKSPVGFVVNRWPLLELKMTRQDCIVWLTERGLPVPPKSACVCCPYRRATEWLAMKQEAPSEFEAACQFDEANRHNPLAETGSTASALYLWPGLEPLREVDFETQANHERKIYGYQIPMSLFLCESGQCWV